MRLFATLLIAGLLTGCPSTPPPPTKAEDKNSEKGDLAPPAKADPVTAPAAAPLADPPWFDTAKIEHAKVLQPRNQAKVGPNTATAMLLELSPGTTTEACITAIRTEMAKTIPDLAEAVPGDKGRMTIQGKTADYSYTVVCGPGKDGQPTSYLSWQDL